MKVEAQKVVWISIKGDPHPEGYMPDDHGLVSKFGQWCLDNEIYTVLRVGHSGGGGYGGAYDPEDLPRIKEFFAHEGYDLKVS